MKKLLSLLLLLALALSLAACGEKSADETARQTPPTLTVTSANACSVTLKSSSYDWTYPQGLQSMTVIACGAHPLDENCRDITPVLEIPFTVSAAYFYTVTLDFGDILLQLAEQGDRELSDYEKQFFALLDPVAFTFSAPYSFFSASI